jgi:dienelactone hydrolase
MLNETANKVMKMRIITLATITLSALAGLNGGYVRAEHGLDPSSLAPAMSVDRIHMGTNAARDLEFPTKIASITDASRPEMAIFKPEGDGPFPALVLAHQCSGLRNPGNGWQNEAMLVWARKAVDRGYVVLLIDQLRQRGVATRCKGKSGGLNFARATKDMFQAAEHLRRFDFVDADRIALAGYSFGGMLALLASSKVWGETLGGGARFAAAVSFYPGCFTIRPRKGLPYEIVNNDIDRPLLVLMGAKDGDTPAAECTRRLEFARAKGASAKWHVYPDATHCWDCENLDGHSKTNNRGNRTTYYYDKAVTQDSTSRMFSFLAEHLKPDSGG